MIRYVRVFCCSNHSVKRYHSRGRSHLYCTRRYFIYSQVIFIWSIILLPHVLYNFILWHYIIIQYDYMPIVYDVLVDLLYYYTTKYRSNANYFRWFWYFQQCINKPIWNSSFSSRIIFSSFLHFISDIDVIYIP